MMSSPGRGGRDSEADAFSSEAPASFGAAAAGVAGTRAALARERAAFSGGTETATRCRTERGSDAHGETVDARPVAGVEGAACGAGAPSLRPLTGDRAAMRCAADCSCDGGSGSPKYAACHGDGFLRAGSPACVLPTAPARAASESCVGPSASDGLCDSPCAAGPAAGRAAFVAHSRDSNAARQGEQSGPGLPASPTRTPADGGCGLRRGSPGVGEARGSGCVSAGAAAGKLGGAPAPCVRAGVSSSDGGGS
jgi:hypothetical protein